MDTVADVGGSPGSATGDAPAIRVLLVDDSAAVRFGLSSLLDSAGGFTVVGQCADGAECVEAAKRLAPHVIVMDAAMPGVDGVAATVRLLAAAPGSRVLFLTSSVSGDTVRRAHAAGAVGYLSKSAPPDDVVDAIRRVASGSTAWSPAAAAALGRER
ncbi:MAG TPA: response regulator transcription factor [Pseudonocardia sp.]|nr:response regulator transcription factor [Pseudonocardia sp.]